MSTSVSTASVLSAPRRAPLGVCGGIEHSAVDRVAESTEEWRPRRQPVRFVGVQQAADSLRPYGRSGSDEEGDQARDCGSDDRSRPPTGDSTSGGENDEEEDGTDHAATVVAA